MIKAVQTSCDQTIPEDLNEENIKRIFTSISDDYERFNHRSSFGQDRRWLERLVELAPINSKSVVLDVAGGTGEVTFAICRKRHPAKILLSDYTPDMLDVAKRRLANGEGRNVDIETMVVDAQDMPLDDESFDVVTMAYGIRNMPNRMAALREIYRVLKPGGTAVILEFSHPPRPLEAAFYRFYLKVGIPAWGKHIAGTRDDFVYLAKSIEAFPCADDFAAMLRDAGFTNVAYEYLSFGAVAIHSAHKS